MGVLKLVYQSHHNPYEHILINLAYVAVNQIRLIQGPGLLALHNQTISDPYTYYL